MKGGKFARQKGDRFEREVVQKARDMGLEAHRNFLSRSPTNDAADVVVAGRKMQVKKEASGFKRIFRWLEGVDGLVVGADREEPIVVIRYNDYLKLLAQLQPRRFLNLFQLAREQKNTVLQ